MMAVFGVQNRLKLNRISGSADLNINFLAGIWLICILVLPACSRLPEDMSMIPKGEFIMGNNTGDSNENPERKVYLNDFFMDKYEVTNEAYLRFVKQAKHGEPKEWQVYGYMEDKKNHPVVFVSFDDALGYCNWLGKRLPTEEEWEKAARGTGGYIYPWGNEFELGKANTSLSGIVGTTEVGMYEGGRSPYGLYDMAGNIWEWTSSTYIDKEKAVKGGSWGLSHKLARTFTRIGYEPGTKTNNIGFRCAKDR
ncbi:MAG: SUMF1/EgtB/PvdO family nonheme iron enzyme [Nitrospinae bacterium]|nr:SUMF1/EgtB/PvdO family nonheme iron enzyme [Nitrospinota bacterium]